MTLHSLYLDISRHPSTLLQPSPHLFQMGILLLKSEEYTIKIVTVIVYFITLVLLNTLSLKLDPRDE